MRKAFLAASTLALVVGAMTATPGVLSGGLVVHEWGTFLTMNGLDGVTLDGMYHEEHALPAFVHARSRDELRMRSSNAKFETPVIYFYADAPRQVRVEVGFPNGLWTQWYPQATFSGPSLVQMASLPGMRNGRIGWTVDVSPSLPDGVHLPAAGPDALWNHSREVDAVFVSALDEARPGRPKEWERFVFYRGLGETRLPIEVTSAGGGRIACGKEISEGLRRSSA
jgi:hypothetical protein